jgi:hypothetical protein
MIATKGELTDRQKLEDKLLELFGVSPDSWLYPFAMDCAHLLASRGTKCETPKDLADYLGYSVSEMEEWKEQEIKLIEQGWTVFYGSVHSDAYDSQSESYLVDFGIDYQSDDLIFEKGAGF